MRVSLPIELTLHKYPNSKNSDMERCETIFNQSIKSSETKRLYNYALKDFQKFHDGIKLSDILLKDSKDIQIMVEDYIFHNKEKKHPKTIMCYLNGIKHFFVMNDVLLNWNKLNKFLPERPKPAGQKAYSTEDVREILELSVNRKFHAIVHILASSGMRLGSLPDLQVKHLTNMPHGCKSVLVYAGSKDEYMTFISSEAVKALDDYFEERKIAGENITSESYLIRNTRGKDVKTTAYSLMMFTNFHTKRKSKRYRSSNNRLEKQTNHAFRKRFNTILKSNDNANISLIERLLGHSTSVKLDNSYFDPSVESLFKEYLKGLPRLYIDEKFSLESELAIKQQKIEDLESDKKQIELLQEKMTLMQAHIENIQIKS